MGQSSNISEEDVPGVSLNGRKPEHLMPYLLVNQLQVMNISAYIPSQVNMAKSDVATSH